MQEQKNLGTACIGGDLGGSRGRKGGKAEHSGHTQLSNLALGVNFFLRDRWLKFVGREISNRENSVFLFELRR